MKRFILVLGVLASCLSFALAGGNSESAGSPVEQVRLKMATTTSTENSGLLDVLLPAFTEKTGIPVDVIAVGTGKAIAHGANGDVDLIFVHARAQEDAFVATGTGIDRRDVMHNDFVILGPAGDPAGIRGMTDASQALKTLADRQADFISRGDDSGTHIKEKELWTAAGVEPSGTWYKEAGQGMGAVINMADNLGGYTMADRGTYLAMKADIGLQVLVEGDPVLFNPYGIIAINPKVYPHVLYPEAMKLIEFITSREGQELIAGYTVNGEPLFFPDAL